MIVFNGYISCAKNVGGGLDGDGNPVQITQAWSEPIPCRISTNRYNALGVKNGNTFTIANFEVLIERQLFEATRLRLNKCGQDLGEFSVMSSETLESVETIKILV